MAEITVAIHIDAKPQEVWDVATDVAHMGRWVSIHDGFPEPPPSDLKAGSKFRQTLKVAGKKFQVAWTATEVDSPERLVWDGTGPAGTAARTSYTLEPDDDGTRFTYENEFTLPAGRLGRAAGKVVAGQAERQAKDSLGKLKKLIEE